MEKYLESIMGSEYQKIDSGSEDGLFLATCLELCLETMMDAGIELSDIKYRKCEYEDDHCTIFRFYNESDNTNIRIRVIHDEDVLANVI